MEIHYTITTEDFLDFNRYCYKHVPLAKKHYLDRRFGRPLALVMLVVLIALFTAARYGFEIVLVLFPLAVIYIICYPLLNTVLLRRMFNRRFQQGFPAEYTVSIDEKGVRSHSTKGSTEIYWETVKSIIVTDRLILFFYDLASAIILTKRGFANDAECTMFLERAHHYRSAAMDSQKSQTEVSKNETLPTA